MATSILIAGYGWWGQELHRALRLLDQTPKDHPPLVGDVGIVDSDASLDHSDVSFHDFVDALDRFKPDAVLLATPDPLHPFQIERCAERGIHVYCEKPLALTLAEGGKALAACERAKVVLAVGFHRRQWPSFLRLRQVASSGRFGRWLSLSGNYSNNTDLAKHSGKWRADPVACPGGPLTGMGLHPLDLMVALAGPARVVCSSRLTNGVWVDLDFENGAVGRVEAWQGPEAYFRLTVIGEYGWAELSSPEMIRFSPGLDPTTTTANQIEPLAAHLSAFLKAIDGDKVWPIPPDELRNVVTVTEQAIAHWAKQERSCELNP